MNEFINLLKRKGIDFTLEGDNLTVGGYLDLQDCTGITALPDNLTVGGSLAIDPKKISNAAYKENCGYSSRTIYAVWVGGNFKISAGCFFDTLDKFEQAVDEKYSGSAAEAYKQAGRDCVAELTLKLNKEAA